MDNKLGVSEYILSDIEKKLINLKLNLIDCSYTFNEQNFNLNYLIKLNKFLFGDFYDDKELEIRHLGQVEEKKINYILETIVTLCLNQENNDNIDEILDLIEEIWHLQLFTVGNTRTLIAYLKVLNDSFLLGKNVDVNMQIENNPSIFKEICGVNSNSRNKK